MKTTEATPSSDFRTSEAYASAPNETTIRGPFDFKKAMARRDRGLTFAGIAPDFSETMRIGSAKIADICRAVMTHCHDQLSYNIFTNGPAGIDVGDDPVRHAIDHGLVSTISARVDWDIYAARRFCAELLEDVNDHEEAAIMYRKADIYEEGGAR